jgi:NADH dehydrogenase/NADH:ubiquinone oxidoreductase subunit G
VVKDKELGPLIATDMTRCIHCSRCVRFGQEIAGRDGTGHARSWRAHTEVMPFLQTQVNHELSGNVIELCPVGALTSKPFRYSARSWELSRRTVGQPARRPGRQYSGACEEQPRDARGAAGQRSDQRMLDRRPRPFQLRRIE